VYGFIHVSTREKERRMIRHSWSLSEKFDGQALIAEVRGEEERRRLELELMASIWLHLHISQCM
jgi:hypothetical protein